MTDINPLENANIEHSAPVSLDQAAAMLQQIEQGSITFDLAIRSDSITALIIPDDTYLRVNCAFKNNRIDPQNTHLDFVDKARRKHSLRWLFFSLSSFTLRPNIGDLKHADLIGTGWLWFIPVRKTLLGQLPLDINALLCKLARIAKIRDVTQGETSTLDSQAKPSVFNATDYSYQVQFYMTAGSTLELNEGTSVVIEADGNADVHIKGVHDYSVATITGTGVKLDTSLLSTGPSDLDIRVTLNRRYNGSHQIAFDDTTLREVQFKSSDFDAPPIETLRIDATDPISDGSGGPEGTAKTYDFIITINPHDDFTMKTLIAKITARIRDPQAAEKLRQKLTGKAGESQQPSEIVIDSARWSIVDYVTHDLRGQFSSVKDLPHIREHLDDPAIKVLAKQAVQHLRVFIEASHFQLASTYDPVELTKLARLILSAKVRTALSVSDPQALTTLLQSLGYSNADSMSILVDPTRAVELNARLEKLRSADQWDAAKSVETVLRSIGNALNARERAWIREAWVDAGGMESEGRAYALLANFSEALIENLSNDEEAPLALKAILTAVPRGEELDRRIAVSSDNIRGAIWSAHGVLRDGWRAVSQTLENMVAKRYGDPGRAEINLAPSSSAVFLDQSNEPDGEKFIDSRVHFVRDGEEFFQQIIKLLGDSEHALASESTKAKSTIALNYWAIESFEDPKTGKSNFWGLKIAERLKDLAMQGFVISIVVDEKNGPSRLGRRKLAEIASEVKEEGTGRFEVHPWTPSPDNFPLSSHVKYLLTPIGVIAGGSNIGDHYAHWSDTNMLLSGAQTVERFWKIHKEVLQEQREVGQSVSEIPDLEAINPDSWTPLLRYQRHGHEADIYDPEWQDVRMRVFRDQGGDANDRILVEIITALNAARGLQPPNANTGSEDQPRAPDTVYIANAYFVLTQPIDHHPVARAIRRAVERGVNIELMTNSADSCDEPAVAGPIVKSAFLILAIARDVNKIAAAADQAAGRLTVHLPDKEFFAEDENNIPQITIHDKTMFFGNMAFVTTHNLHPRSFTLEQELLTEMVGAPNPAKGTVHNDFMNAARHFLEELNSQPGGDRITDLDKLLAPIDWSGETPPSLWGPGARLYLLWLEKQYLYCHSFSSASDEEVQQVEAKLDESSRASLADLLMNIF